MQEFGKRETPPFINDYYVDEDELKVCVRATLGELATLGITFAATSIRKGAPEYVWPSTAAANRLFTAHADKEFIGIVDFNGKAVLPDTVFYLETRGDEDARNFEQSLRDCFVNSDGRVYAQATSEDYNSAVPGFRWYEIS